MKGRTGVARERVEWTIKGRENIFTSRLQTPELDDSILGPTHTIPSVVPPPLDRTDMTARRQPLQLPARPVPDGPAFLSRAGDDLARVKLQARDRVVERERVGREAISKVPDTDRLVERAGDDVVLVELKRGDGSSVADKRAMSLTGTHFMEQQAARGCQFSTLGSLCRSTHYPTS